MPELKAPRPKPIVRNGKIVNTEYCSCSELRKAGFPWSVINCNCPNNPKNATLTNFKQIKV